MRRTVATLAALVLLAGLIAGACGDGSGTTATTPSDGSEGSAALTGTPSQSGTTSPGKTPDSVVPRSTLDADAPDAPRPTDDVVAGQSREAKRDLERAARKLSSLTRVLELQISQASRQGMGTPEESQASWFEDCCDDSQRDIAQELREVERGSIRLTPVYEEADDRQSLAALQDVGTAAANIDASLAVLVGLPTVEGAATIAGEMSQEVVALTEAVANLR